MPVKNFLTPEQVSRLQSALKESELPYVRERILILLLQNDGKTQQEIAKFIGCSPRTVAYWCMHGDPDNLESLHNKREQESYRKATPEYLKLLLETVDKDPQELGYEFGRWTGERLATYLAEQTGIELSSSQIIRILKRKKYSYIWAKYSLEDQQNQKERAEFTEKITRYLAITKEKPEQLQVWFWDETGFSLRVIRRKTWEKKGKRKKITGQRRRGYNWRIKMRAAFNTDHSSHQQITRNKAALIFKASPREELTSWEVSANMTESACAFLSKKAMQMFFMSSYSS